MGNQSSRPTTKQQTVAVTKTQATPELSSRHQAIKQEKAMLESLDEVEEIRARLNNTGTEVGANFNLMRETIDMLSGREKRSGETATVIRALTDVLKSWEEMKPKMENFTELANKIFDLHDNVQASKDLSPDELGKKEESCHKMLNELCIMAAYLKLNLPRLDEIGKGAEQSMDKSMNSLKRSKDFDKAKIVSKGCLAVIGMLLGIGAVVGVATFLALKGPVEILKAVASTDGSNAASRIAAKVRDFFSNLNLDYRRVNGELVRIRQCQQELQMMMPLENRIAEMIDVVHATMTKAKVCHDQLKSRLAERQRVIEDRAQLVAELQRVEQLEEEVAQLRAENEELKGQQAKPRIQQSMRIKSCQGEAVHRRRGSLS